MNEIPVYEVKVPEYKVKKFNSSGKKIKYAGTPWFDIEIPKIYFDNKPDFEKIGKKIDACLKKYFLGKEVAVRVLSSDEHNKSVNELIEIIKRIGHDRYDPKRNGDRYENLENKRIDFFALDFKVKGDENYFKDFIEPFYFWPITTKEAPIRVDIAIIYDLSKLEVAPHSYEGRENEIKKDGFIFRDSKNKSEAILGIIKIL